MNKWPTWIRVDGSVSAPRRLSLDSLDVRYAAWRARTAVAGQSALNLPASNPAGQGQCSRDQTATGSVLTWDGLFQMREDLGDDRGLLDACDDRTPVYHRR
jgi:hypothetical protein